MTHVTGLSHVDRTGPEPPTGRRREVLTMLRESTQPLSILAMAERLGVHPNTVRFHLDALTDAGQVERIHAAPTGPGRPPLTFRAHPGMDPTGPRNYRLLAEMLANNLAAGPDPVARATEAGRAWGARLAAPPTPVRGLTDDQAVGLTGDQAVGQLVGLLDDLGFAPTRRPSTDGMQIGLGHCPFLELVQTQPRVVCRLHLGLMQGAMTALGTSVTVERLDPFVQPDLCLAHLNPIGGAPQPEGADS